MMPLTCDQVSAPCVTNDNTTGLVQSRTFAQLLYNGFTRRRVYYVYLMILVIFDIIVQGGPKTGLRTVL